jgi:hypothetical protein
VPVEFAGGERLEVTAGEALVAEDDLPAADQVVIAFQRSGGSPRCSSQNDLG